MQLYSAGISDYQLQHYGTALEKFTRADEIAPGYPSVETYIQKAKSAIQQGQDRSNFQSFATAPSIVDLFLLTNLQLNNNSTGSSLFDYLVMQSVPDKYAEKVLNIPGQYVTTVAYQDRYGRAESNNNLNVFLQISHNSNSVTSLRGVELGGDSISVGLQGKSTSRLVNSAEIHIPNSIGTQPTGIPQKVRDSINSKIEPTEVPAVVNDFLNNHIDLVNNVTGDHLTHFILVQTVPDVYAQKVLGIQGQFVTTLAFEDRYGRAESNNNLNVFLQISHTNSTINSMRGIQLGGDDIKVFVNGVDEGTITKSVDIY